MIVKVKSYVDELNADLSVLEGGRGPNSKYILPDGHGAGHLDIEFEDSYFEGIACSLESLSYKYDIPLYGDSRTRSR
jgi:acetylornithine deacetylase